MRDVLRQPKKQVPREHIIRVTDRDLEILTDLGTAGVLTYRQIQNMHFPTYISCAKRIRLLQMYDYMDGTFHNTNEKVFVLGKEGVNLLRDLKGNEFKIETYENVYHKIMRAELYTQVKNQGIEKWVNEAKVESVNSIFDVYFEHDGTSYFCEVHNTQSSKKLKEKMIRILKLNIKFCLLIYCRDRGVVKNLISKMNEEGFSINRNYAIKVFEYGEEVTL